MQETIIQPRKIMRDMWSTKSTGLLVVHSVNKSVGASDILRGSRFITFSSVDIIICGIGNS